MTLHEVLQSGNYTLIDVREPMELEIDGNIAQAINIPVQQIPSHLNEIKEMKGTKIIFCRSGGRAGNAAQFLLENGVTDVLNGGGYSTINLLLEDLK